jgi:hypothetical protein
MIYKGLADGGTDVTALAQAFLSGLIHPSYTPVVFQPSYLPSGQTTQTGAWENCDLATTQQVASLVGGSVFNAPPPGNYQYAAGTQIPQVPWVRVSGGSFVVGDVFPPGVILNFQSLCAAANEIAASIPGGTVGASCNQQGQDTPAFQYQNVVPPNVVDVAPILNPVKNTTNTNASGTNPVAPITSGQSILNTVQGDVASSGVPSWELVVGAVGVGLILMLALKR